MQDIEQVELEQYGNRVVVKINKLQCRFLFKTQILLPFTQDYCHLRKTGKNGVEKMPKYTIISLGKFVQRWIIGYYRLMEVDECLIL